MSKGSKHIIVLFIAALCAGLFTTGCNSNAPKADRFRPIFADSIIADSLSVWMGGIEDGDKTTQKAYVMDTLVPVYRLSGTHLYLDTTLKLADSVSVTKDGFAEYFEGKFYPVSYNGRTGYIRGTSLAYGLESDFDNDGKKDLVLYGYNHFIIDTTMANSWNPIVVKFVTNSGIVSEVHDTAYSNISFNEVGKVRLSKKVHCYEFSTGYPACGYPQYHFIIAFGNGKAEIIHRSITSIDSGFGDFCEFYYPVDSTRRTDTIYISHKLAKPLSDDNDSIVYSTADSTILYLHEGRWGEHNYKMDPSSN